MKRRVSYAWLILALVLTLVIACHERNPVDPELDSEQELGKGIHVNPSSLYNEGVDSLTFNTGDTMDILIESILLAEPRYSFSTTDNGILEVLPDNEEPEVFHVVVHGDSGASTVLRINDTANNAVKEVPVGISDHWANPDYFEFLGTVGSHYYYLSTDIRSWVDAHEFCQKVGGYMAVINSEEENDFLDDGRGAEDNVWIGLRFNKVEEDKWRLTTWVNGDSLDYDNFRSKPGGPGIFAEYYFHMDSNGEWENWHEISYHYFLEME